MAKVDLRKLKERRDQIKSGGDFLEFQMGNTLVYVCPPPRQDDDLPYIEVKVHQKFNPSKSSKAFAVCLDPDKNPWLLSEHVEEFLTRRNKETGDEYTIDVTEGCPVCEALAEGRLDDEKERGAKDRWLYGLAAIKLLPLGAPFGQWTPMAFSVRPYLASTQVGTGIMEVFMNQGDITDFDAAIFCNVSKTKNAKKKMIEYDVTADAETQKKPIALAAAQKKAILEAMKVGGPTDLYRVAAAMIKPREKIIDMMTGNVELDEGGGGGGGDAAPSGKDSLRQKLADQRAARKAPAEEPAPEEPVDDVEPGGAAEPEPEKAVTKTKPADKPKAPAPKVAPTAPKATAAPAKAAPAKKAPTFKEKALALVSDMDTDEKRRMTTCFGNACDIDDEICRGCRMKVPCAEACNLAEPPPDLEETQAEAGDDEGTAPSGDPVNSEDCLDEQMYLLPPLDGEDDQRLGKFVGVMKGKCYFEVDGENIWVPVGTEVYAAGDGEATADEPEPEPEPPQQTAKDRIAAKRAALAGGPAKRK